MRNDIIRVSAGDPPIVRSALIADLGLVEVRNQRTSGTHLEGPDGREVSIKRPVLNRDHGSTIILYSNLGDGAHNAWSRELFAAACAAVSGNVELLDEDDKVILSRSALAAV